MNIHYNGPLAELPIILDSFFNNTTSNYRAVEGGGGGSHWSVQTKHSQIILTEALWNSR